MFPNISDYGVEWRIQGFRIRATTVLFVYGGGLLASAMFVLSPWVGVPVAVFTLLFAFLWTVFVYRYDPNLTIRESTLIRLIFSASKKRYINNETTED